MHQRESGQFTQPDPNGLAGGLNLYGYGNADPVNNSDPFGLTADTTIANAHARAVVAECKQVNVCRIALDSLAASPLNWTIKSARSGGCGRDGDGNTIVGGCSSAPGADGQYDDTEIILLPGDYGWMTRKEGRTVNGLFVFSHEMGHVLTEKYSFCAGLERCATGLEEAVRFERRALRSPD